VVGPDTKIPFLPWTKAMFEYNKSNQVAYDPQGFCLPPGGPRMFGTPYPSQFIQQAEVDERGRQFVAAENNHVFTGLLFEFCAITATPESKVTKSIRIPNVRFMILSAS